MVGKTKNIRSCPDCGSDNIIYKEEENQLLCKDCGLIYEPLMPKEDKKFKKSHNLK
jgi:transcription initiation factor TFIIIB Brf1 subunit/transcription initiation factor TFIIB